VDLDLNCGCVRFFRNGHPIGSTFQGIAGPIAPVVAFAQGPGVMCQVSGKKNLFF
jgi:hypothetical protein